MDGPISETVRGTKGHDVTNIRTVPDATDGRRVITNQRDGRRGGRLGAGRGSFLGSRTSSSVFYPTDGRQRIPLTVWRLSAAD